MTAKRNDRIEEYFHWCSPHEDSQDFPEEIISWEWRRSRMCVHKRWWYNSEWIIPWKSSLSRFTDLMTYPGTGVQSHAGSHQEQILRNLLTLSFPPGELGRGSDICFVIHCKNNKQLRYSISQNTVCCIVCAVRKRKKRKLSVWNAFASSKGVGGLANFARLIV